MDKATNIVVVVSRSTDAGYVLHKAAAIARATPQGASVHVVRVMFEDYVDQLHLDPEKSQALKRYLMQAEEEFLVDLVEDHRADFTDIETATLWNKRVSDAVMNVADTFEADLIIKSADPDSPHFPRHPDDWNLLREARCPVFLVKPEPWPANASVVAAVNMADVEHAAMNRRILEAGALAARSLPGKLHIVNALVQTKPLLTAAELGVDFERLELDARAQVTGDLNKVLKTLGIKGADLHITSGLPATLVTSVADETDAAIVVVGTAGRKGISALIIGNTSETLLHTLHHDLLVLHV
ncbi:MAG: universal stress protein [Proteobacteria bacterium]|nr:universal stress protein [Pseudomonadota bacterium]